MPECYKIAVLPGEGVGPEVVDACLLVLKKLESLCIFSLDMVFGEIGKAAFEKTGQPLSEETVRICRSSDSILFGAVEQYGILELRKEFSFYANLRPVVIPEFLASASSLKPEHAAGVDILFVRELISGIYFGPSGRDSDTGGSFGYHTMKYYDHEIDEIADIALKKADLRKKHLTVAHKENALPHIPWRDLVKNRASGYPDISTNSMLVDNLAMQLVRNPKQFDVVLAGNLFGDLLSDIGGALSGSLGLLPSASISKSGMGLFEAIHGTAPDIAGKGIANPVGTILSAAMMLEHLGEIKAAEALKAAVYKVLERGFVTPDLSTLPEATAIGTMEMAEKIASELSLLI